ncbi:MAG TPA: AAA family ATPase [Jatrophihabitans sp.]|nr:AAA family ATPase [Jatrophihabitans sp.]
MNAPAAPNYAFGVLRGREREQARIAALLDEARGGRGGALVVRGEPGVGKSSLLRDAVDHADGSQSLLTRGIESESPLAFAALQRLLRPLMRFADRLPTPQATALRAAFGEQVGGGDRFLIFLGALNLLAEAAEQAPVLCVIDDAHWLDDASSAALLFVARRLGSERVALLFAAREGDVRRFDSEDLPALVLPGLDSDAATAVLADQAGTAVPSPVRDQLLAQTGGNPLALVELPKALSAEQLSGADALPPQLPLTEELQRVFLDRSRHLSRAAQTLLLVAAADDSSELAVIRAAFSVLDTDAAAAGESALEEAERSGLVHVSGARVEMRHPLVRSALYQAATSRQRRQTHAALAAALVDIDADRRAWHLAAATDAPDAAVVAELDQAAERAQRRGGYEAASAALERAAELTVDEQARARRLLAAAFNAWLAGQLPRARLLADAGRRLADDPVLRSDLDRLRGRIEFNIGLVPTAIRLWTRAARDVAEADPARAREVGMFATAASTFMPPQDRTDLDPAELGRGAAHPTAREQCFAALLVGFHQLLHDDLRAAAASLRTALRLGRGLDETDLLTNLGIAAFHVGDDDGFRDAFARLLARSRESGALGLVLFALPRLALGELTAGRWANATANAAEALQLARDAGQHALTAMPLAELALHAALRGEDGYAGLLADLDIVMRDPRTGILGELVQDARRWAQGVHDLLSGQPGAAVQHLAQMTQPALTRFAAYDRLDAAVRAERADLAAAWLVELAEFADAADSPRARAVVAYGRALLADAGTSDSRFNESLSEQAAAGRPFETARTQLAYGEFLRRARRRVDARDQLRAALAGFEELGATPWAERARAELRASGESARKRDDSTTTELTAQERQVARQVAQGLSNREVAAQLFLSPRTIDFHLRNVFAKAGITSRGELVQLDLG